RKPFSGPRAAALVRAGHPRRACACRPTAADRCLGRREERRGPGMRRRARSLPDREVKAEEAGDGSKSAPLIRYTFVEVAEPSRGTGARRRRVQSSPPELTGHTTEARQAVPSPRVERPEETETRTTVVIRGMPHALTRAALLEAMDGNGFRGAYDFVYLPIEFNTGKNFGYAFVNFVGPAKA
ncbi:unnamed protein product, partial [Prorocentrum cordatum]